MPSSDLFGDSFIDQTLKEGFIALTDENQALNSRIDQLESELAAMHQANQFLKSQLSIVQDDLLVQSSQKSALESKLNVSFDTAISVIERQNQLISRQISLLVKS